MGSIPKIAITIELVAQFLGSNPSDVQRHQLTVEKISLPF